MTAKNILIIKTGKAETFAGAESAVVSLGEVLRSTVLLHLFPRDQITWITSREASPLLRGNIFITKLLCDEDIIDENILSPDIFINLEKDDRWNNLFSKSSAFEKYGLGTESNLRIDPGAIWQDALFRLVGKVWQGEEYVYSLPPKFSKFFAKHNVGLNWAVGRKWPTKVWPQKNWEELAEKLSTRYSVSWQQGFQSIDEYAHWIASCDSLITTDSLGLHIAIALKKPVFAIFGPTAPEEIHFYGRGQGLKPDCSKYLCSPCHLPKCPEAVPCMNSYRVDEVCSKFINFFEKK